jgi:hypothetical protein
MLLVKTDSTIARLRPTAVREKTRQVQAEAIRGQIANKEATIPTDGAMDVTKELDRAGQPLSRVAFVKQLKRLNANLHYEASNKDPTIGGIYFLRPVPDPDGERRIFICRCEVTMMPEYHVFKPQTTEMPDPTIMGHMRKVQTVDTMIWGWRTVLARVIRGGYVTQTAVDRAFGLPTKDSSRWQTMTGNTLQ